MDNKKKRIVIVGATSAIAEHCARQWIQDQALDLTLVGRDPERLHRVAGDLRVRSPASEIRELLAQFDDAAAIDRTIEGIVALGPVDIALIAHGALPEQAQCEADLQLCREALEVNGISPVLFAEAFARRMARSGKGTLALIGSVAGERGRKSNYVYGSAKGLVTRYAQGLQHRFAGSGVKVVLVKAGPTDTRMTAHLKRQGAKLAPVEQVARSIVAAIDAGRPVVYVPAKWQLIMGIIRHLPPFVFNKMNI